MLLFWLILEGKNTLIGFGSKFENFDHSAMTLLPYYVLQHMAVIGSELKVRTKANLTRKNIKSGKFNQKSINHG